MDPFDYYADLESGKRIPRKKKIKKASPKQSPLMEPKAKKAPEPLGDDEETTPVQQPTRPKYQQGKTVPVLSPEPLQTNKPLFDLDKRKPSQTKPQPQQQASQVKPQQQPSRKEKRNSTQPSPPESFEQEESDLGSETSSKVPDRICIDTPWLKRIVDMLKSLQNFFSGGSKYFLLTLALCFFLLFFVGPINKIYQCTNGIFNLGSGGWFGQSCDASSTPTPASTTTQVSTNVTTPPPPTTEVSINKTSNKNKNSNKSNNSCNRNKSRNNRKCNSNRNKNRNNSNSSKKCAVYVKKGNKQLESVKDWIC